MASMAFMTPRFLSYTPPPSTCLKSNRRVTHLVPSMKSKRRRKPPSQSPSQLPSHSSKSEAPLRIGVNSSTLSLREQLSIAKRNISERDAEEQELQGVNKTRAVERTKFRRKKLDPASRRRNRNHSVDLPDGKYNAYVDPLIFVDGYNVIGAWPKLRKWRDRDLETARRLLLNDVEEFGCIRGWECIVVFDAQLTELGERTEKDNGVTTVFTGSETADSYIERSLFERCKHQDRQVWAATSDITHGRVSAAIGAHIMSATLFIQELKRARRETREKVSEQDGSAHRAKMLMSTVDKSTLQKLYKLRDQLDGA